MKSKVEHEEPRMLDSGNVLDSIAIGCAFDSLSLSGSGAGGFKEVCEEVESAIASFIQG